MLLGDAGLGTKVETDRRAAGQLGTTGMLDGSTRRPASIVFAAGVRGSRCGLRPLRGNVKPQPRSRLNDRELSLGQAITIRARLLRAHSDST